MRILGIDPGATCGWCVYDDDVCVSDFIAIDFQQPDWVAADEERWVGNATVDALSAVYKVHHCDLIAIEEPFVRGGTGPAGWAVGETCKVFGYIRGRLEAYGLRVVPVAAGDWQKALTGKARCTKGMGKLVKAALSKRVHLPKRSSEHERDACGIAWFASEQERGRRAA